MVPDPFAQLVSWLSTYFSVQPDCGTMFGATVRVSVVVWLAPTPLAVMVIGYVPTGTELPTAMVTAEVPDPGVGIVDGLKPTLTPVGCPEALSIIGLLNAPIATVVTVALPDVPPFKLSAETLVDIRKSAGKLDASTFNSATTAQGLPLTSLISLSRTYCACVGLNITVFRLLSPEVVISVPLEANVQLLPSLLV